MIMSSAIPFHVVHDPLDMDPFYRLHLPYFSNVAAAANTPIDWKETQDAHVFTADLPGLARKEVRVEVIDGAFLQISGERSVEEDEAERVKGVRWHLAERSGTRRFMRRFRLPEGVEVDGVKAVMRDGVLTVTVPKNKVGFGRKLAKWLFKS